MPRKSSLVARIKDLMKTMAEVIDQLEKEQSELVEDSAKYREMKPILEKLAGKTANNDKSGDQSGQHAGDQSGQSGEQSGEQSGKKSGSRKRKTPEQSGENTNPV